MTTGLKLGSGYARWRPPSRAVILVQRWWWVAAIIASVSAMVAGAAIRTRTVHRQGEARAAAETRRGDLQAALACARAHQVQPGERSTARIIMATFMSSLSEEQVETLVAGRDLSGNALSLEQKDTLLRYLRATHTDPQGRVMGDIEGMEIDSVGYYSEDPGPGLILRRWRPKDNKRGQALFGFPPEWKAGN